MSAKQREIDSAKEYLKINSTISRINLYDHLTKVMVKILGERPVNVVDIFEDISYLLKKTTVKFEALPELEQDEQQAYLDEEGRQQIRDIRRHIAQKHTCMVDEYAKFLQVKRKNASDPPVTNVMETMFNFELVGLGLSQVECHAIYTSLNTLIAMCPTPFVRFWGKISGLEKDYYVAEIKYQEELFLYNEELDKPFLMPGQKSQVDVLGETELEEAQEPPNQPTPTEPYGKGINANVYFVSNGPGTEWCRLPMVTPDQIVAARKVRKLFTGNLNTPVGTETLLTRSFPGTEMHYLRAQIGRISAGTQISPIGAYRFPDEDDDEYDEDVDVDEVRERVVLNADFEQVSITELEDPQLFNWVHHARNILTQGRCSWIATGKKPKKILDKSVDSLDSESLEGSSDEDSQLDQIPQENGPPLLTPLSEDVSLDNIPPWSVRRSSVLGLPYVVVSVRSNLWPGACAYSDGSKFENVYIGNGLKFSGRFYQPELVSEPAAEYVAKGTELDENVDALADESFAAESAVAGRSDEAPTDEESHQQTDDEMTTDTD